MPSHNSQAKTKQQQRAGTQGAKSAPPVMQSVPRNTTSTAKISRASDAASQQLQNVSRGQGNDDRSEPPRPRAASLATASISPSESISVRGISNSSSGQSRPGNWYNTQGFQNGPTGSSERAFGAANRVTAPSPVTTPFETENRRSTPSRPGPQSSTSRKSTTSNVTPSVTTGQHPSSSSGSNPRSIEPLSSLLTPPLSTNEYPSSLSQPNPQRIVRGSTMPSTANVSSQRSSGAPRSFNQKTASEAMGGSWSGSIGQDYATQQPAGGQLPVSIGIPSANQVHFHFNQVDNRKMTVNNNAPQNVVTNNNQVYNVDKSNHHNTQAPQTNTYNSHVHNAGNTHANTTQQATAVRQSLSSNTNGQQREVRQPSESLPLRDRLYTCTKKVTVNEWSDKRSVKHKHEPNDRPC
ncbi:hypothetical protein J7T55_007226 [Diaporthe amygdali]|uniref:uncharacterized protein n=1 Tax=Phomopsis amygdali TaxID=1214568 RepID=UPI0022FEAB25|nr:uncharacterized protein J7T55_007226 [Diaporthe amygdali]KAJ0108107.1 hypothetical protein J7T55_007226 [Diaporthe amygdali]